MPAKASEIEKVARKLGFVKVLQKGSHARWKHPDDRRVKVPDGTYFMTQATQHRQS